MGLWQLNEGWCTGPGRGVPGVGNVSVVDGQRGSKAGVGQFHLKAVGQLQRGSLLTLQPRHIQPVMTGARQQ